MLLLLLPSATTTPTPTPTPGAGEIHLVGYPTGASLYALLRNASGEVSNGTTFETLVAADWAAYATATPETAPGSGTYTCQFPLASPLGDYSWVIYRRFGATAAVGDEPAATGSGHWDGTMFTTGGGLASRPATAFGTGEFAQYVDPDLTGRTFLATLILNWLDYPQLIAISPQLYADEAPEENLPSYVVLSLVSSNDRGRNVGRGYWKEAFYQFSVYANTKVLANTLALEMCLYLDRLQDVKPTLSEGYLMSWFHAGERALKVPGRGKAAKFVWQESHTYKATIGRLREAP